ncbi:hypothetical protein MNEG_12718, partial [Monoraphidium neglectum]
MDTARLPSGFVGHRSPSDSLSRRSSAVPLPEQRSSSVVLRQGVAGAVAADEPLTFNNQ